MKKILLATVAIIAFALPSFAQQDKTTGQAPLDGGAGPVVLSCYANESEANARIATVAKRIFFMVSYLPSVLDSEQIESADKGSSDNGFIFTGRTPLVYASW